MGRHYESEERGRDVLLKLFFFFSDILLPHNSIILCGYRVILIVKVSSPSPIHT